VRRFFAHRPWGRALAWLCVLGPFFFLSYGFANHYTASLSGVESFAFAWERHIPFWPWTIIPYWSIDFLYGASLFLCLTKRELDAHAWRLALASCLCVAGFLLFPLRFSFERPEIGQPFFHWLFAVLGSFDLPYNQAPSLHICLLFIIWERFAHHSPPRLRPLTHIWALLIGISVLTTWQHHVIDVITGLPAGLLCCYLVPEEGWHCWRSSLPDQARKLAWRYGAIGAALTAAAVVARGWAWLLLWPGFALLLVAAGYLGLGPGVLQKTAGTGERAGLRSVAARWLLAPYEFGARWYRARFFAYLPGPAELAPGLWLGGYPSALPVPDCGVLDLTSEYPRAPAGMGRPYAAVPMLDLVPPTHEELAKALEAFAMLRRQGPVIVHCALGLTRSVLVAACALVREGRFADVTAALAHIAVLRPGITVSAPAAALADEFMRSTGDTHVG